MSIENLSLREEESMREYLKRLEKLRGEGESAVLVTKQKIDALKENKLLSESEREEERAHLNKALEKAKQKKEENSAEIAALSKEALAYSKKIALPKIKEINESADKEIARLKEELKTNLAKIDYESKKRLGEANSITDEQEKKFELKRINFETKSFIQDKKNYTRDRIQDAKEKKLAAYNEFVQVNRIIRGGTSNIQENITLSFNTYITSFSYKRFLLNNGIYLTLLLFFIVCVIIAPQIGMGQLFTLPNILTILEQSSTQMFYALGVAGLILLAGTDLSIGRMVALGSITTGIILHPGRNIVKFMGMGPWDFSAIPMPIRVVLALTLSILFCSMFSAFAGVFTAKLKMHPFITTLSTQLIIYGILFFGTSGVPTGSIEDGIRDAIGGRWLIGYHNGYPITFPKLIIPAIIAIVVAWFIWNKTTFGKNMYAVGGNAEAAAVSGINVFKTTLLIFVMAGIFYGCGAFLEAFSANASAGTGQGFELDAIAACVVGGISFSGGIGKIRGAVIGVIIFTALTYCLTFLGIDTNLQFVFKGFIILAAVALDSVKYLKRK